MKNAKQPKNPATRSAKIGLLLILSAFLLQTVGALAASGLSITPGPYIVKLPQKDYAFTITNHSNEFIAANLDFVEMLKPFDLGSEKIIKPSPTAPIVVSPQTVQVRPGESRTIRIQWRSKSETPPKYYWLLVSQVLLDKKKNGVALGANYKIPVYVEVAGAQPKFFVEQRPNGGDTKLTITNTGQAHDYIGAVALSDRTVLRVDAPLLPGHPTSTTVKTDGRPIIAIFTTGKKWFGVSQ